ncbi:MAG TPA: hypothetical protein VNZ22_00325 [Bacillota bacterium]|nr:hypothetical protein [Bacillota bacterium]
MKTLILVIAALCAGAVIAYYVVQSRTPAPVAASPATELTTAPDPQPVAPPAETRERSTPKTAEPFTSTAPSPLTASSPLPAKAPAPLPFQQALGSLLSPQATFEQKQAAWNQLKASGHMDQVIAELEQRASANPTSADYPATLGQAYLQKAGTLQDVREQGILGMKADQSFDAALNIDSSNWEARFWKASALSYWPPQLNKGKEVIEHCLELVKLQETQAAQPQFAQTYMLLGEQYQKQGYPDYAKQAWQRGATLFPNHAQLQEKLNAPPQPAQ